jgi:serine/threonine-protein kinase
VPEEKLLPLFRPVLDAVGYAHHHGILHRDIKPLNILFAESGVLKVGDFGIAKMVGGDTSVSMSGTRVGTPAYMSPEQVFDKRLTRATDIYSLGCTLYESATGKLSFKESDTSSLLEAHVTEPPVPPRQVNPGISESLERVILKALEKKPGDRFQGCEEFAEALAGVGAASQPRLAASNGLKTHPEPDSDVSHLPSRVLPPVPEAGGLKTKPERYNGIDAGYEGRRGTAHKVGLIRKVVAVIFLTLAASCVPPLVAMLLTLANGLLRRG